MAKKNNNSLPLTEQSINEIYNSTDLVVYEVPIYQRNFAWEKEQIEAMINDVCDAWKAKKETYYIGTLVTHQKEEVFEVIDGQQRLTTIYIILKALGVDFNNRLTYRARNKSDMALKYLGEENANDFKSECDDAIMEGYKIAKDALENQELIGNNDYTNYFLHHVHIIHYRVPRDINLNQYFEVMNSRGEQLEKHEIVKANLINKLSEDRESMRTFAQIWDSCANMNRYIQQKFQEKAIFGNALDCFQIKDYEELFNQLNKQDDEQPKQKDLSIIELIQSNTSEIKKTGGDKEEIISFQSIIDFPNFLLIVLKLMRLDEENFIPQEFILDDKELLKAFDEAFRNLKGIELQNRVKQFAFYLLKAKFLLDNYIVHIDRHAEDKKIQEKSPWELKKGKKENNDNNKNDFSPNNLSGDSLLQKKLVHKLSLLEVTFTPRQRKNYLLYCLIYLFKCDDLNDFAAYDDFLEKLLDKYLKDIYLNPKELNEKNTPSPNAFDGRLLRDGNVYLEIENKDIDFVKVFGDGTEISKGIPLFVFNYLDYKIWKKYATERVEDFKKEAVKTQFFDELGCTPFDLNEFQDFYFSRTRRSLEHYFPQANVKNSKELDENKINCFGNYAMIGSAANSAGSNWSPKVKCDRYLDSSEKIDRVSVSSLKFLIMMQKCKDGDGKWDFENIQEHQKKMVDILLG